MFFGKASITKRIFKRISAESPQSVSIVGERRIGKSSLLNFLNFPSTRLSAIDEPGKYIFLFIDFQALRTIEKDRIIGAIFSTLRKQYIDEIEILCGDDFDGMRFFCDRITEAGYKFILFFDEFESVTKNEQIGPDFYSFLRSLANNFSVAFITASGRNLKDMCVSHEISDSPFFNIFSVHHLDLFKTTTAFELVSISKDWGISLIPIMDKIIEQGGLYPFFLQMACSAWFEFLETEGEEAITYKDKKTPKDVISMFREEAEPHFEYVFETFLQEEKGCF